MKKKTPSNLLNEDGMKWVMLVLSGYADKEYLTEEVVKVARVVPYRDADSKIQSAGFAGELPVYIDGANTVNSIPFKFDEYCRFIQKVPLFDTSIEIDVTKELQRTKEEDKELVLVEDGEEGLKSAINEFMPIWTQHKTMVPYTIIIPTGELSIEEGSHWIHYQLAESGTADFINDENSLLAYIKVLSSLGVTNAFIESMLIQMGRVSSKHKKVDNPSYQFINPGTGSKEKMLLLQGKLKEMLAAESSEIKRSIKLKSELLLRLKLSEGIKYSPLGAEKIANLKEESLATEKLVDDDGFYYRIPCSTEQDQTSIRNTLVSLMAYSSGLMFTINIPLLDEKMHALKGSTPTLIIPDEWCKNIKANRTSNKKGKKATKVTSGANFDLYIEDPNLAVRK